ncbi:hypothetical protein GQ457_05G026060 [Hibiscus cannabinus]
MLWVHRVCSSNVGRGEALMLIECQLGGVGLDGFEHKPEVPEELSGLDNVVLLPYVGSGTVESRKAMVDLVLGNLESHFLKKPLMGASCCFSLVYIFNDLRDIVSWNYIYTNAKTLFICCFDVISFF